MRRKILSIIIMAAVLFPVWAQEAISDDQAAFLLEGLDDDSLFGDTDSVEVIEIEDQINLEETIFEDNSFQWGGKFTSTFGTRFIWQDSVENIDSTADGSLWEPDIECALFFDARPAGDFRVFGKVKAAYPFDKKGDVSVYELFTDYSIADIVNIRAGKQTVKWGVGYFYSPADILSISPIDAGNAEAEREGPLAVKANLPIGSHNGYLYFVAHEIEHPGQLTIAPKIELVAGPVEFTLGGMYNHELAPRGTVSVTGPFFDFDLLAEARLQYGSDAVFLEPGTPPNYIPAEYEIDDRWFFSGTAGALYNNENNNLTLLAQYWYDGEAYSPSDIKTIGSHFGAFSAGKSFSFLEKQKISVNCLFVGNLSDISGFIEPKVSWEYADHTTLFCSTVFRYGDDNDMFIYSAEGARFELSLGASLGYGSF